MRFTWPEAVGILLVTAICCGIAPATARADRTWNNQGTTAGDWNNASLWTPTGVPGSADYVTIPARASLSPVSKSSGDSTIRGLGNSGTLSVTGGSITVTTGFSFSAGSFTVGNGSAAATFAADGAGTSFVAAAGTFNHNGGNLLATDGATILVSTPTVLRGRSGGTTTVSATARGKLSLTGVTQIIGNATAPTSITADGGTVDISNVSQPVTGNVSFLSQNESGLMNIPSGGSGWKLQARNGAGLNVADTGNANFANSTIGLEDANVFFGTDSTRSLVIAANSKLNVTAELPVGQVSTIYGGLINHGQIELGPYSELHLQWGFHQFADGKLTLNLDNDLSGIPASAGPVLGIINGGPGTEISLAGNLTIDSTLKSLPVGNERTIMFATEPIVGHFDTVTGMKQANGLYLVPVYYPEIGAVTLVTTIGGDANRDALVDGGDYTVWADNYLRSASQTWDTGDFTGDGRVDGADYTLWADHFSPTRTLAVSAVPEPTTLALAVMGAFALAIAAARRRFA